MDIPDVGDKVKLTYFDISLDPTKKQLPTIKIGIVLAIYDALTIDLEHNINLEIDISLSNNFPSKMCSTISFANKGANI